MAADDPKPAFDITRIPPAPEPWSPAAARLASALFVLLLGATSLFLWFAHRLDAPGRVAGALLIVTGLWSIGWIGGRQRGRRPAEG